MRWDTYLLVAFFAVIWFLPMIGLEYLRRHPGPRPVDTKAFGRIYLEVREPDGSRRFTLYTPIDYELTTEHGDAVAAKAAAVEDEAERLATKPGG